jgi:hypothetical protein
VETWQRYDSGNIKNVIDIFQKAAAIEYKLNAAIIEHSLNLK